MENAQKIREIVSCFLSGGEAEKFIVDFSSVSYQIRAAGDDRPALEIVNKIESQIAAVHNKHMSIPEFRDFLRTFVNPFVSNTFVHMIFTTPTPVNSPAAIGMASPASEMGGVSPKQGGNSLDTRFPQAPKNNFRKDLTHTHRLNTYTDRHFALPVPLRCRKVWNGIISKRQQRSRLSRNVAACH
jgi:hypothetical protein